ncbi:hypothetical protein MD273_01120 [Marinobacter pelagius]|uniref:hypothetical protein n=1 Tax=Marinobacter sp. C7 TaxID=2951363 RepID=UPI001EF0BEF1|nr:hypothetical protein [Marinobacter sp. C7]MCG7198316.1 hypothetical protein [Marinobacter sp. C7]
MKDTEVCRRLLGVEEPWTVTRVRIDTQARELHAFLDRGKGWFNRVLFEQPKSRWRHSNLGAYKAFVHSSLQDDLSDEDRKMPFIGQPGSEFTTGLARKVTDCLRSGLRYREVCELLEIDVHLAWQIRHAIQNGLFGREYTGLADRMTLDSPDTADALVPPASDPVWQFLLESGRMLETRLLSLRLLLTRARQEFPQLEDDVARSIRITEIRRFFVKHRHQLPSELRQLRALREEGQEAKSS